MATRRVHYGNREGRLLSEPPQHIQEREYDAVKEVRGDEPRVAMGVVNPDGTPVNAELLALLTRIADNTGAIRASLALILGGEVSEGG